MKTLYKTMLLTTAALCLATGGAMAEGSSANSDSQSYNMNSSAPDGNQAADQSADVEPGNANSANRSEDGMDSGADANANANASMNADSNVQLSGLSNQQIQDAQQSLRQEGHSLSVDGIWGPQTAQAVRQFQQENGLDVTGSLDSETLAALDVDANANASTDSNAAGNASSNPDADNTGWGATEEAQ